MAPGKQVKFCIFLLMPRVQRRHHQQKNSFERKGHYKERNPLLHHGPSGLQSPSVGKEAGPEWQVSPLTPGIFHISPAVHRCLGVFLCLSTLRCLHYCNLFASGGSYLYVGSDFNLLKIFPLHLSTKGCICNILNPVILSSISQHIF